MAEQNPSSQSATAEEDLALDELLEGEQAAGKGPVKGGPKDEEDQALDDLLAGDKAGADQPAAQANPATDGAADEEALALDELVAAENREAEGEGKKEGASVAESADDGIITLKEVVALGGTSAEEMLPEEDEALDALMGGEESPEEQQPGADIPVQAIPAVEQAAGGMEGSGLSREERDDLDKLIKGLKEEQPPAVSSAAIADLQKQVKAMRTRVIQLTKIVSEYDKKMKACSEIMRLFYQKSEVMNERIDAISDSAKGGKKR
jgi:hypothetical protein